MVHRRGVVLALIAPAMLGVACKKPAPTYFDVEAGAPIDHLEPGEIPEGREKAYALTLPVQSAVLFRFPDSIEVESQLTPEELSNYVRKHVQTQKVTAGAQTTSFDEAVVASEPKRILHIDVSPVRPTIVARSTMLIRDVTPATPPPKVSDEDAWKKAGRGPDGRPLDESHIK